jgi:serine/threonine protein kinase/Ran GTPase-activating protein (RanGAP) involved in mRNA processing and transport
MQMIFNTELLERIRNNDPGLTSLDLADNQIGDAGVKELSAALKENRILTSLDLGENQIGAAGAKELSAALKENRTLTELNLGWNQIGDAGAKDLGAALKENRTLTTLNLWSNQIGAAGAKDLSEALKKNRTLTTLHLSSNDIRAAGAEELSAAIKENRTLTTLDLDGNQIGAAGAQDLSAALKENRAITKLSLRCNQIGAAGAKELSAALKENHTLTSLNLNSNQIGAEGAKELSAALKENRTLTSLNLGSNQIGAEGAKDLSVVLKENHTLTSLNLGGNQIGDARDESLYVLIKRNCDLRDEFLLAAKQGNISKAQELLNRGVSVHGKQDEKVTALHLAAENGQLLMAQWLMNNGANLNCKNKAQQTPLDLAKQNKHQAIIDHLSSYKPSPEQEANKAVTFLSPASEISAAALKPPALAPESAPVISSSQLPVVPPAPTLMPPSVPAVAQPMPFKQIAWKDLVIIESIGQGGFGEVFKASWQGITVAVKQLHLKTLNQNIKKEFEREAQVMADCRHPNIVQFYGVCMEPQHNAIIMEHVAKGSLYDVLHNEEEQLPWVPVRWQIALDIGKGLSYLHSQKITHRDLKSHNIFIDEQYHAKIGDFGLAKLKIESSVATTFHSKNTAGSTRWKAPELFKLKASPNFASDVYSYGVVMWEIASRTLPFSETDDDALIREGVMKGEREVIPADCPPIYKQQIEKCWQGIPEQRPTAEAVVTELQMNFPKPQEKSWHFDPASKKAATPSKAAYTLIAASQKDFDKVIRFYQHHPVPGMDLKKVEVIYNRSLNREFELRMRRLQERDKNKAFAPD